MANRLKLCVDWTTKTLVRSLRDHSAYRLPDFHKYETIPLQVQIIEPGEAPTSAWLALDIDNIALSVSMHGSLDDNNPFALQETWTKDSEINAFLGELELNTTAANAYLAEATPRSAYFEIVMTEGSVRRSIYVATVTFAKGVLQPGAVGPEPIQAYYTAAQVDQLFLKPILPIGQTLTFRQPNWTRTIGLSTDGASTDDVAPAP